MLFKPSYADGNASKPNRRIDKGTSAPDMLLTCELSLNRSGCAPRNQVLDIGFANIGCMRNFIRQC
eukprot:525873-Amphidinium_carterae.3